MKNRPCVLSFFSVFLACLLPAAASTSAGAPASSLVPSIIREGGYLNWLNGAVYQYQLLQLSEPGGRTTYAIWLPPNSTSGLRPAVLITEPYMEVDWSTDPVDLAWAARFNHNLPFYPDVNGPFVNPTSGPISYALWNPGDVPPEGLVCLGHNMGVLLVFERFYAGGTVADNVKDTTLGLEFLQEQSGIDLNHLGIFGESWGGFEAIYGAANAPAGAVPAFGVARSPPSDLGQFYQYATQGLFSLIQDQGLLAQRLSFYDPYVRRIAASTVTSLSPLSFDFSAYGLNFLQTNLKTKFLVLHDQWDTLVPFSQSVALVTAAPNQVQGLWYPHVGAIDYNSLPLSHEPVSPGMAPGNASVFTCVYLLERLLPLNAPIFIPYRSSDLINFFAYMRDMQKQGQDISSLVPRLGDLADSRIVMVDMTPAPGNFPPLPGSLWTAYFLNLP
jgi:hypothetical protein